jgi:hypothetical protein
MALSGLGAGGLGVAFAASRTHAAAQEGTPMVGGTGFAGSWRVIVSAADGRTFLTLTTYGADGTVLTSALPAQQAPPNTPPGVTFFSTAHGAWAATGPDTANVTFIHLRASAEGQPLGTTTIRLAVTLGADGGTFDGDYAATVADPKGNVVTTFAGTVQGMRIAAEAPGTPEAGTPSS